MSSIGPCAPPKVLGSPLGGHQTTTVDQCGPSLSVPLDVQSAFVFEQRYCRSSRVPLGRGSSAIWQPLFSTQQMKSHSGHTVVRRHAPLKLCLIGSVLRIASDWFSMWCSLLGGPARSRCPLRSPGKHRLARLRAPRGAQFN